MRKPLPDLPQLTQEELATEVIELTCDEVDSLSRAFRMISQLCDELKHDVIAESLAALPEEQVH